MKKNHTLPALALLALAVLLIGASRIDNWPAPPPSQAVIFSYSVPLDEAQEWVGLFTSLPRHELMAAAAGMAFLYDDIASSTRRQGQTVTVELAIPVEHRAALQTTLFSELGRVQCVEAMAAAWDLSMGLPCSPGDVATYLECDAHGQALGACNTVGAWYLAPDPLYLETRLRAIQAQRLKGFRAAAAAALARQEAEGRPVNLDGVEH